MKKGIVVSKRNMRQVVRLCGDEKPIFFDDLNDALIGCVEGWFTNEDGKGCSQRAVALYDRAKCIRILMRRDGMTREEASDFFDINIVGTYVGPRTPVFATFLPKEGSHDDASRRPARGRRRARARGLDARGGKEARPRRPAR